MKFDVVRDQMKFDAEFDGCVFILNICFHI